MNITLLEILISLYFIYKIYSVYIKYKSIPIRINILKNNAYNLICDDEVNNILKDYPKIKNSIEAIAKKENIDVKKENIVSYNNEQSEQINNELRSLVELYINKEDKKIRELLFIILEYQSELKFKIKPIKYSVNNMFFKVGFLIFILKQTYSKYIQSKKASLDNEINTNLYSQKIDVKLS